MSELLADLIAAHEWVHVAPRRYSKCLCGWQGDEPDHPRVGHPVHVAEVLAGSYDITPKLIAEPGIPCDDWADGHSYRKCTLPRGHEGHHG